MKWYKTLITLGIAGALFGSTSPANAAVEWPTGRHDFYRSAYAADANQVVPPFQLRWGYWAVNPGPNGPDTTGTDDPASPTTTDVPSLGITVPPVTSGDYLVLCNRRSVYGFNLKWHAQFNDITKQSAWSDADFTSGLDELKSDWRFDLSEKDSSGGDTVKSLKDTSWRVYGAPTVSNGIVYVPAGKTVTDSKSGLPLTYGSLLALKLDPSDSDGLMVPEGKCLWREDNLYNTEWVGSPIVWNITKQSKNETFEGSAVIVVSKTGEIRAYNAVGKTGSGSDDAKPELIWSTSIKMNTAAGETVVGDPLLSYVLLEKDRSDSSVTTKTPVLIITTTRNVWMIAPSDFTYQYWSDSSKGKISWKAGQFINRTDKKGTSDPAAAMPLYSVSDPSGKFTQGAFSVFVISNPEKADTGDDNVTIPEDWYIPLLYVAEERGGKGILHSLFYWDALPSDLSDKTAGSSWWDTPIQYEAKASDSSDDDSTKTMDAVASCPLGLGARNIASDTSGLTQDEPLVFVGTDSGRLLCYKALGNVTRSGLSVSVEPEQVWADALPKKEDFADTTTFSLASGEFTTIKPATTGTSSHPASVFIGTQEGRMYVVDPGSGLLLTYFDPSDVEGITERPAYRAPVAFWEDWAFVADGYGWLTAWKRYIPGIDGDTPTPPTPHWGHYDRFRPPTPPVINSTSLKFKFDILDPTWTRIKTPSEIQSDFATKGAANNVASITLNNGDSEDKGSDGQVTPEAKIKTFEWGDTIWVGLWNIEWPAGEARDSVVQSFMLMIGGTPITRNVTIKKTDKAVVLPFVLNPFAQSSRDVQMNNTPLTPGPAWDSPSKTSGNKPWRFIRKANDIQEKKLFNLAHPLALIGSDAIGTTPPAWEGVSVRNTVPRLTGTSDLSLPDLESLATGSNKEYFKNDVINNGNPMAVGGNGTTSYPVYVSLGINDPGKSTVIAPSWPWDSRANLAIIDRSNLWGVRDRAGRIRGVHLQKLRVEPAPLQRARVWNPAGLNDWPINFFDSSYGADADREQDYPSIPASSLHVRHLTDQIDATAGPVVLENAANSTNLAKVAIDPKTNPASTDARKLGWCFQVSVDIPKYQPADPGYKRQLNLLDRSNTYGFMTLDPDSLLTSSWEGAKMYRGTPGVLGDLGERDYMIRVYVDTNGNGKLDLNPGYEEAYRTFMVHTGVSVQKKITVSEPTIDLAARPHGFNPNPIRIEDSAPFTLFNGSNVNLKHILADTEYFPLSCSELEPYTSNMLSPGLVRSTLNLMAHSGVPGAWSKKPDVGSPTERQVYWDPGSRMNHMVTVALPNGVPEGYYQKKFLVYVDEPATDANDPKLGSFSSTNGKLDVTTQANGTVVPMEPYADLTSTLKIKAAKSRLTDVIDPVKVGLPKPEISMSTLSSSDSMPAAYLNDSGMHLCWTRTNETSVGSRPAGESYLYLATLAASRIGTPMNTSDASWWSTSTQYPSPDASPYSTISPTFQSFSAPSIATDASGNATLYFQGEAWKQSTTGDTYYSNIFSVKLKSDGTPDGTPQVVGVPDPKAPFIGSNWRRPQAAALPSGSPWVFWYGGSGNQWRLYYANPANNIMRQLPIPSALSYAMEPSPVARVWGSKKGFDVVYTGLVQVDGKTSLYLGRYVDAGDGTLVSYAMPKQSEGALKPSSTNRALYYARGIDWDANPKNIHVIVRTGSTTYDLAGITPTRDSSTGKLYYTVSGFGKVVVDPSEGTVLTPVILPIGSVISAEYLPKAVRLTTDGAAESAPVAFLDTTIDPASLPNHIARYRLWVFHKRAAFGGQSACIGYKALRLGINVGEPIGWKAVGQLDAQVSGVTEYCVNPQPFGQFFFTGDAEYQNIGISYNGKDVSGCTVGWIQEKHDAHQGSDILNTDPPLNDSSVWATPEYLANGSNGNFVDKIWVFWSSTRSNTAPAGAYLEGSGGSDIYYQTISPRLTP